MANELIRDRGRGPELRRCRITVYDLIPYLDHEQYSDSLMLEIWPITAEELAALKQYIAEHYDEVMAVHRKIEERIQREMAAQDTPEFQERTRQTRERMKLFQEFVTERKSTGKARSNSWEETREDFHQWLETHVAISGVHNA